MEPNNKIWEKSYSELSPEEKDYVSEWCENATDFEQIKYFMLNMNQVEKKAVQPSPQLKKDLLAHFPAQQQRKPGFWMNAYLFIFPQDGSFNWKPVLVAATLIGIVFTVVMIGNPFENANNQLSDSQMEEVDKEEESKTPGSKDIESEEETIESESLEEDKETKFREAENDDVVQEQKRETNNGTSGNTNQLDVLNDEVVVQQPEEDHEVIENNRKELFFYNTTDELKEPEPTYNTKDQDDFASSDAESVSESEELSKIEEKSNKDRNSGLFSRKKKSTQAERSAPAAAVDQSESVGGNVYKDEIEMKDKKTINANAVRDVHELLYTTY